MDYTFSEIFLELITLLVFVLLYVVSTVQNPVYSILAFVAIVLQAVLILIALDLEFLAYVLAIIYIGAIVVLFLFVVMMFTVKKTNECLVSLPRAWVSFALFGALNSFSQRFFEYFMVAPYLDFVASIYSSQFFIISAQLLFNDYFYLTVFAGTLMLLGIIIAISVSLRVPYYHSSLFQKNNIKNRNSTLASILKIN